MASPVKAFSSLDLMELTSARVGETKVGQRLRVLPEEESLEAGLKKAAARGARFGLLLAAEDVGPRANCGRPGADEGPRAFMESFANLQDNRQEELCGFYHFSKLECLNSTYLCIFV